MIYLVDTNIISEMMRPLPNTAVQAAWEAHAHEIAISTITWHELLAGTLCLPDSKRRDAFENFLHHRLRNTVELFPYNEMTAEWHAVERARLTQIGRTPSFPDGQIAAIAATNALILVTRNVTDFSNFDGGLCIENWFEG